MFQRSRFLSLDELFLCNPKTLVASVALVSPSHPPSIPAASGAVIGLRPAWPALVRPVFGALSTGTDGVPRHADSHTFGGVLLCQVLTLGCKQLQILRCIVEPIMVSVMHYLFPVKQPPKRLLHDEAMLEHPAVFRFVRMLWLVLLNVGCVLELLDSGSANFWRLPGGHHDPKHPFALSQTVWTDGLASPVGPANDGSLALGAWKHGSWFDRHTRMITQGRMERNSRQQSEWVTVNRPPVHVPGKQVGLFG